MYLSSGRRASPQDDSRSSSQSSDERRPFIAADEDEDEDSSNPPTAKMSKPEDAATTTIAQITSTPNSISQHQPPSPSPLPVSPSQNAQLLHKIDLTLLPILLTIYILQYLDKTTLSYASVFGLIEDLHLRGQEFSWTSAIVYVAQLIWQPLVAYALVKLPMGKFCAGLVLGWGATLCGMAAAKNFAGLMVARFILGSFEAGVAPVFIAVVQVWYRRSEQTGRNAMWYSMVGVVGIFGSLLCYGLAHIESSVLRPFQIIFLFCGCLTVAFSFVVFLFLPDSPMTARFLKEDEKLMAIERVRMNQMGTESGVWRWDHVSECLTDPKTWLWFSMLTVVSIPSGGISTFGPLIIKSFGFDSFSTILFNMPYGAAQFIATIGGAVAATRWKVKGPILAISCVPPIVGLGILLGIEHTSSNRGVLLFAYYLTAVYPVITPLIYSWSGQNTAGDTKRKVTTGIMFIGASAGNILGPNLYTPAEAPQYRRGLTSNLILFVILIVLVGLSCGWIAILNKRHASRRTRMGKAAKIVDVSMQSNKDLKAQDEAVNHVQDDGVGEKAFDDMTDLKNEDFIFVY